MIKIGFLNCCHEDYVCEAADRMAGAAVKALEADGISVCRVKEPLISGGGAREAGRTLLKNDVQGVILFLGTWIECPVVMSALREIEHLPLCLWGFPMFMNNGMLDSTGSYVSYTMFKGVLDRAGYRFKGIMGMPEDAGAVEAARAFASAAACSERLKRATIGLVGYTSMGIYTGTFDHLFLRVKIGPEVEHVDAYTVINRAESAGADEKEAFTAFVKSKAGIRNGISAVDLDKAAGIYAALKELSDKKGFAAINVKCQYEFTKEYKMTPCVPLSVLADNGVTASCEGDMLNTVSMLILHYLTGMPVTYGDCINSTDEGIYFSACGFMPFSFGEDGRREIWRFHEPGFNGLHCGFVMKPGRVTVLRLIEDRCDYHILYMTGEGLDSELRQGSMPAVSVRLDGRTGDFLKKCSGQHYAICYGDLSEKIEDLARILNIPAIRV